MRRLLLGGFAFAVALLLPAKEAEACSWCALDAPRCEPANYRKCSAFPRLMTCQEWYSECAWVFNADEISADGSLATYAATDSPADPALAAEVRGCHGLIIQRSPSAERIASVRAATRRIVI